MIPFEKQRSLALVDALAPERLTRICDVGASPINRPPYADLFALGACEVIGFEPAEGPFQDLEAKKTDRETYHKIAVGDGRTHNLNICAHSGFTSTLEPNDDVIKLMPGWNKATRVVAREPLQTQRLDDLALPDFDFLKIDVQGLESLIFAHARSCLGKAVAVMSEVAFVPLYLDQPLLDAQMAELRECRFAFHKQVFAKAVPFGSRHVKELTLRPRLIRDQYVDGDAVFVRELLDLSTLTPEKLKHLAILADAVFGSATLALAAITHLEDTGHAAPSLASSYIDRLNSIV